MLSIAAMIVADTKDRTFAGMDLNERVAHVAADAGIHHCYFMGPRLPDLRAMKRLRARGAFTMGLAGWPRVFTGVPNAETIVIIDARTIIDGAALRSVLADARNHAGRASLLVELGERRKDSLIRVDGATVSSVMGDGNAMNCGVLVMPLSLVSRVRTVHSLRDAVHRLAKAGLLAAVPIGDRFCRVLDSRGDVATIERESARVQRMAVLRTMALRIRSVAETLLLVPERVAQGL